MCPGQNPTAPLFALKHYQMTTEYLPWLGFLPTHLFECVPGGFTHNLIYSIVCWLALSSMSETIMKTSLLRFPWLVGPIDMDGMSMLPPNQRFVFVGIGLWSPEILGNNHGWSLKSNQSFGSQAVVVGSMFVPCWFVVGTPRSRFHGGSVQLPGRTKSSTSATPQKRRGVGIAHHDWTSSTNHS